MRNISLDKIGCTGTEAALLDCAHDESSVEYCTHDDDAGVTCALLSES